MCSAKICDGHHGLVPCGVTVCEQRSLESVSLFETLVVISSRPDAVACVSRSQVFFSVIIEIMNHRVFS